MSTSYVLSIVGLIMAAIVTIAELSYFFAHLNRPGVSPHIIGLGVAAICVCISQMLRKDNK